MAFRSRQDTRFRTSLEYGAVATIARPLQERITATSTSRLVTLQYSKHSARALGKQRQTSNTVGNTMAPSQNKKRRFDLFRDAAVMDEWHSEWDTAPYDPLPSNLKPLKLLCEPTWVHLDSHKHVRNTNDVLLVHYSPSIIPEARARQDLELQKEQRRYLEEDSEYAVTESQRALSRLEVVKDPGRTDVEFIDMTQEEARERKVLSSTFATSKEHRAPFAASSTQQYLYRRVPHLYDSSSKFNPPEAQGTPVWKEPRYQIPPQHDVNASLPRRIHSSGLMQQYPQYRYRPSYDPFTDKIAPEYAIRLRSEAEIYRPN
jgi:hypothetical protein